jgi:hypothetical protein
MVFAPKGNEFVFNEAVAVIPFAVTAFEYK